MEAQCDKKLTFIGRKFHALGMFLLRRKTGQEVALFVRAFMSLFSKNRSFKTDSRNIILQTFFTGVEIFPILFVVATLFGTVVIIEVITMMGKMGFDDVVGGVMVVVIIRELGPVLKISQSEQTDGEFAFGKRSGEYVAVLPFFIGIKGNYFYIRHL